MDFYKNKKMEFIKEEIWAFFSKFYVWILYVFIGLLAHVSHILAGKQKPTTLQFFSSMGIAIFVGYLSSAWCIANAPEQGKYIVPIATLLSDKVLSWIMTNWKLILRKVLNLEDETENKSNIGDNKEDNS